MRAHEFIQSTLTDVNTANSIAKDLHSLVKEFGELLSAGHKTEQLKGLRSQIQELDLELKDLGFLYTPNANNLITPIQHMREGQIYSGGNKEAGLRWYQPRNVPNQDNLLKKEDIHMIDTQNEGDDKEFHTGGGKGIPNPSTYEQETLPYRTKGQRRTQAIAFEDENISEYSTEKIEKYYKKAQEDMANQAALAKLARIDHLEDEAERHERRGYKREQGLLRAEKLAKHKDKED
jgi:hypothetical protein